MKVLLINTVCGRTSTGRICSDIADILTTQGHECKIAYGVDPVPEKSKKFAVKIGRKADLYSHAISTRIFDNTGFCSTGATKKFIQWVKEYDPDIVHLHNIHGYYINIKILFEYLKETGKPLVWTLHDCWSFTGHCAHYSFQGCSKWITKCFNCPLKKEYPASLVIDNSAKNYLLKKDIFTGLKNITIVTPSMWLAEEVKKSFLKNYSVKVINNGIDLELFKPFCGNFRRKYDLENKKIILGVANIWSKRKGIEDFIKLSKILDENYKIVIVGKLQGDKLPKNTIHIPHTDSQKELAEIYTTADVFVNPTYEDTFPTTNLEALACGTPVITYKTGGSPEAVKDQCGMIVECGDVDALADAIKKVDMLEKNCLEKSKDFDKNARFEDYITLYKEILK